MIMVMIMMMSMSMIMIMTTIIIMIMITIMIMILIMVTIMTMVPYRHHEATRIDRGSVGGCSMDMWCLYGIGREFWDRVFVS